VEPQLTEQHGLSVAIPSYRRGRIALETIERLRGLDLAPDEILLIDQTEEHPSDVEVRLEALHLSGVIHWLRLDRPSIPHAMNVGLASASRGRVLFLDDDCVPRQGLVGAHIESGRNAALVAGQVLQPGQLATVPLEGKFAFNSSESAWIEEFMGGNFSIDRVVALALRGFDENFIGAAYRFEAEFAARYVARHGKILFEPKASIDHLAIGAGGTRAHGHHLRTAGPAHSVGAYYFLARSRPAGWLRQMLWRPLRSVRTRHHLLRPWWIPMTLLAEARGLFLALRLAAKGPALLPSRTDRAGST
jgi:glycosyltransferase involved in cell wall biosynthesis